MNRFKSIVPFTIIGLYAILAIVIILLFDGTGDAGDSVLHYLYAKSAPDHPELFFNHWAKPVFVLLSSPFAQFGFDGMKLFNVLVMILTLFYTFRVTERLELRNGSVALLAIICAPLALALTFSGLTEPLFALFTIAGLHFVLKNQLITACIIISFLPFVRSEGLIIMSAFGLFLLIEKNWKTIPWLLFGHIAYSFAGYFVYEDILWVFTKIPYANIGSPYGSGGLFHFVEQLLYVIGIPIYLLFGIGIIALLWRLLLVSFTLNYM